MENKMKTYKGYIIKYENDIDCVTNNTKKWLEENNKQRMSDGNDVETLDLFEIKEIQINIY